MSATQLSRRQFGAAAFGAGCAGALWAEETTTPPANVPPKTEEHAATTADQPAAAAPQPVAEEDLLLAVLISRYPSPHLTDERLRGIRVGLRHNRAQGEILLHMNLENSEGPATIFRA